MSLGKSAEAHDAPKSTVQGHVKRLKAGPLPDACLTPTPVIMDASKILVKAGDWKDLREVLNSHAAHRHRQGRPRISKHEKNEEAGNAGDLPAPSSIPSFGTVPSTGAVSTTAPSITKRNERNSAGLAGQREGTPARMRPTSTDKRRSHRPN
jgi:hypothetical protein